MGTRLTRTAANFTAANLSEENAPPYPSIGHSGAFSGILGEETAMTTIRKGIIAAAGRGSRLLPATRTVQKELFPLLDADGQVKPLAQMLVEELLASGLEHLCLIANPANAEPIRRHFAEDDALAPRVTVVIQETQDGFGHAVFQARDWAAGEPILLTLGDHVYLSDTDIPCARQVLDAFAAQHASVTSVMRTPEADVFRYGVLAGRPLPNAVPPVYEIVTMTEKPTVDFARAYLQTPGLPDGEYLVHFGIHAFTPAIFDCLAHLIENNLRERDEFQLTSAQVLLQKRERYLLCEVAGERLDMGNPEGLMETQIALALRSPYAAKAWAMLKR